MNLLNNWKCLVIPTVWLTSPFLWRQNIVVEIPLRSHAATPVIASSRGGKYSICSVRLKLLVIRSQPEPRSYGLSGFRSNQMHIACLLEQRIIKAVSQ
jgi:hypothetical protein